MPKPEYKDRKYEVMAYDPAWSERFQAIADMARKIFGREALAIEHIGSTSVPGMAGKPTIDVLVQVADIVCVSAHARAMENEGYEYLPEYVMPGTVLFRRMQDGSLLENIHVFPESHPHVREMLAIRDYLRAHPEEVVAYSKIKDELFRKYPDDYAMYRKLKDAYMDGLMERALMRYNQRKVQQHYADNRN